MRSLRLLAVTLASLTAGAAMVAAADGKHEYATGHVVEVDYADRMITLDNGYSFVAERGDELENLWLGDSVIVRFARTERANVADQIRHDNLWLVDPPPDGGSN